jgi:hypothetical protein
MCFNSTANIPSVHNYDFLEGEQAGTFLIQILFKENDTCGGELSLSTCSLRHAIVAYDVIVQGESISLQQDTEHKDTIVTEM